MARVGVVVRAHQVHLPAPVRLELRRGGLHLAPQGQRAVDAAVGGERAFPVALEGQETVGRAFGDDGAEEEPSVVEGDVADVGVRIPRLQRPQRLVEVVVDAVGVADEAVGVRRERVVHLRVEHRARVHRLAAEREVERRVPPGDRVLGPHRVRDVRVVAEGIAPVEPASSLGNRIAAWTGHQSSEPVRLVAIDPREQEVDLVAVEMLKRQPDLRGWMTALQACGDVGQVRHDQRRRVVAGVAAGQEDRIESRQVGKHRVERLKRLRPPCRILQIEVRRCPQPVPGRRTSCRWR